jgi:hypothetical protein
MNGPEILRLIRHDLQRAVAERESSCSYLHDIPVPPRPGDHSLGIKTLATMICSGGFVTCPV